MILIYITVPGMKEARDISRHLLEKRLIACTNIFPIESMYWWQGQMTEEKEHVVIAKTREENFEKVKEEVKAIHPYDTPCIISIKVENADRRYLDWLEKETQ